VTGLWHPPRVCLVNPPYEVGEGLFLTPQLGLLNIAAHMRANASAEAQIVDLALELQENRLDRRHLLDASAHRLSDVDCDEYGFSVQCFNLPVAVLIAKRLKRLRPNRTIVFGGHEVALIRESIASELPWIEWNAPTWFPHDVASQWHRIPIEVGPDIDRYRSVSLQPTGLVEIARGCPYSCSFCSIPLAFGHKRTYKPLEQVRDEILNLHASGLRNIHFVDDTLTINQDRLNAFLSLLEEMHLDIAWTGMTRVDLVNAAMLKRMARAGCYSLLYGVESVDAGQRYRISKGGRPYPDLQFFLQWNIDAGIQPTLYFLVGLPEETTEALHETLRIAARLSAIDPGCCHFQLPRIVPGTRLHADLAGKLRLDLSSRYAATLTRTLDLDRDEVVEEIQRRPHLYSTYYSVQNGVDPLARAIGNLGNGLYARWPLTLASLSDAGLLVEWLRSLQFLDSPCAAELELRLEKFVEFQASSHEDILRFERWLRGESSCTILSRVDAEGLKQNLRNGKALAHARQIELVAYRKSASTAEVGIH
jgi:Radical SAM superfamily